jgi:DNA adenine methylase
MRTSATIMPRLHVTLGRTPHPIPYQGSKRQLADRILALFPTDIDRLLEPFAGSAAITLAAARRKIGAQYLLGDSLEPLASLWRAIISDPEALADRYEDIWKEQLGNERTYYDEVRARFNQDREPAKLLYLLARCVKNSPRFNLRGEFNQSPDNRRLGMRPLKMRREIFGASNLLRGRTLVERADYEDLLERAERSDLIYMDPPYQGTSTGRDKRYKDQLDLDRFVSALDRLNRRGIRYLVSFDGRCGERTYGQELPLALGLKRLELFAGRSSQATLAGRDETTVESLYVSPACHREAGTRWAEQTSLGFWA